MKNFYVLFFSVLHLGAWIGPIYASDTSDIFSDYTDSYPFRMCWKRTAIFDTSSVSILIPAHSWEMLLSTNSQVQTSTQFDLGSLTQGVQVHGRQMKLISLED